MMRRRDPVELVAEVAREQDVTADPRWETLAAGTISPADRAELLAMAKRSETARRVYEALQPLGADFREHVADRIVAKLAEQPIAAAAKPPEAPPRPVTNVASRRPRPWLPKLAAASLAVTGVAFALLRTSTTAAWIPDYTMEATGDSDQRSSSDAAATAGAPVRLGAGSRLDVRLRPQTDVTE